MIQTLARRLRVISCFAGIGGFDLGFERAGMQVVAQVEINPKCRKLLGQRFPGVALREDIRECGRHNLPDCDVLCGGFPCQDLSVAGLRAGLNGSRSGLFYELTRIASERHPAVFVWENVPGLLSSGGGRDFARVLMEMDRIGYHGGWRVLDAQYLGVAQRRRRVFGVFVRRDLGIGRAAEILSLAEGLRGHPAPRRESGQDGTGTLTARARAGGGLGTDFECSGVLVAGCLTANGKAAGSATNQDAENGLLVPALARTLTTSNQRIDAETETLVPMLFQGGRTPSSEIGALTASMGRSLHSGGLPCVAYRTTGNSGVMQQGDKTACLTTNADPSAQIIQNAYGVRRLTPRECERLQGFPEDWTAGFADGVRYTMLGNAVAVPAAHWIGRRLVAALGGAV